MKIGMLFPGYGSQFVGMSKELYDTSRIVQEHFEEASHCLDINFVKLCFASSDFELSKVIHAYPALFLVSSASASLIKKMNITIDVVAGYGIGEYAAVAYAGGLSFPDGLYLLSKLAYFYTEMRDQIDLKSISIDGLSTRRVTEICKEHSSDESEAHVAVYENKNECVVSGNHDAVSAVAESASDSGADKVKNLESQPLHTPLMNDVLDQLKLYLNKVDFKDLSIPLITNCSAKEVCKAQKAQDAIMGQIVKPVYWSNMLKQFEDIDLIIIPAPAKALAAEVRNQYPNKQVIALDSQADIDQLKTILALEQTALADDYLLEDRHVIEQVE